MDLHCSNEVRDHAALREAYNALVQKIFGFTFERWYRLGYWGDFHVPYTLFDGDRAVANVSANRMEVLCGGAAHPCVQLGTVMVDPAYRGRGLTRQLMEEVLRRYSGETVFLFANETVLDFYPKFGFEKKAQYGFSMDLPQAAGPGRALDMDSARDRELLLDYYKKGNPFSKIQAVHGESLLMFYCTASMASCVRYLPDQDAVAVVEQEGDVLRCYDVFCGPGRSLPDILSAAAGPGVRTVSLEFTPEDAAPFRTRLIPDQEDALFVWNDTGLFQWDPLLFPVISHT